VVIKCVVKSQRVLRSVDCHKVTNGTTRNWIGQFLTARKQQVVIDGERSRSCSVDSGVAQGTVLGPLLFLCHINDLPSCVTSEVRLFADDCLLYCCLFKVAGAVSKISSNEA
jgi:hypothetical protein